jgi:aromatic-L-amino-acid decarboxylase
MVFRTFGEEGLRLRIREHIRLARVLASWIEADPDFELVAPVTMAVVCFSVRRETAGPAQVDRTNEAIVQSVNATGEAYLTHTDLRGRTAIRLAIGNVLTTEAHVAACWTLVKSVRAGGAG